MAKKYDSVPDMVDDLGPPGFAKKFRELLEKEKPITEFLVAMATRPRSEWLTAIKRIKEAMPR